MPAPAPGDPEPCPKTAPKDGEGSRELWLALLSPFPCPRTGLEEPTPFSDYSMEQGEEGAGMGTPRAPPAPPRSPPQAPSWQHPRSPAIAAGREEQPRILPASDAACCGITAAGPASAGRIGAAALRSLHQQSQPCP